VENTLAKIFSFYRGKPEEIIPILQVVQDELSFLPEEAIQKIARFTHMPESHVYGVATFYSHFRFKPSGRKHVMLCRGTTCHLKGAPKLLEDIENQLGIKEGETSTDLEVSLDTIPCIGECSIAPCMLVNDEVEANLTKTRLAELFGL
jgi:NADH-quinone oxidoreductase subunit E